MKVAFLTVSTPGHLYPTTTLARKLQGRGHDVVLIAVPDAEPFADAAGIPFMPCCEEEYPVGSIAAMLDELSWLQARKPSSAPCATSPNRRRCSSISPGRWRRRVSTARGDRVTG